MRIIGLDLGTKTLGVAVCDNTETIAKGLETIRFEENNPVQAINRLKSIIELYQAKLIVLGLPKNMNNTLGDAAKRSDDFKQILESTFDIPVEFMDERLSSVGANNVLLQANVSRKKENLK